VDEPQAVAATFRLRLRPQAILSTQPEGCGYNALPSPFRHTIVMKGIFTNTPRLLLLWLTAMNPIKVLFVCVHNSARSQMAEAFLNHFGNGRLAGESAGLEPGKLNPRVVQVMQEIGFDISGNQTRSVSDILDGGKQFDYVVTVCDEASAEKCPVFPGGGQRLHWGFPDPSSVTGPEEEIVRRTREIRDAIRGKVRCWIEELNARGGD